jgi:hypothetical protein
MRKKYQNIGLVILDFDIPIVIRLSKNNWTKTSKKLKSFGNIRENGKIIAEITKF